MKPKSKATDASLLTNGLALFGLYAIWKALSAPSRFYMPAGSGYKAAMELKGQGWDRSKKMKPPYKKPSFEALLPTHCPKCGQDRYAEIYGKYPCSECAQPLLHGESPAK